MTAAAEVPRCTERAQLDASLDRLRDGARAWAARPLSARIALAHSMLRGAAQAADRMVESARPAKHIGAGTPLEGEEWLASPYTILRLLRQTVRSLVMLERNGNTPVGPTGETEDGRLTVRVFPASQLDRILFGGIRGQVHLEEGVDEAELHRSRARFHKSPDHEGRVCLVLGAGNVNSIPAADVVTKLFNEGKACVLKMSPVNAYVGPLLEEAFSKPIAAGYLAIVYGGAEEGKYLAHHPAVDEVHITGSAQTHDLIVWGPPGPDRAERMARGQPLLAKPITSELGNVTPVLVAPGAWGDLELSYQADNVAGMVTHNASFNCVAGKVLVLPKGWALRDRFLRLVLAKMALTPARRAWYPGAEERFHSLTAHRPDSRRLGGGEGTLPWTLVPGLDPEDRHEQAFTSEPFCSIVFETQVGGDDPHEFLDAAVRFANERLWGTLSAALCVPSRALADPGISNAVERATRRLRYGSVCVNVWPGVAYSSGAPWGAYPGAPLTDIQSGRGLVHNTQMLERVEKLVLRAPAWRAVKLPYFPSHRTTHVLGRRLTFMEANGRWRRLPGVVAAALGG